MHYRNGRQAQNGDKIVQLSFEGGRITNLGVLHDAIPGNDHCNGQIAPTNPGVSHACLCDCLHIDDVAALMTTRSILHAKKAPPLCGKSLFSRGWNEARRVYSDRCPKSGVVAIDRYPGNLSELEQDMWLDGYLAWCSGRWYDVKP